MFLKTRKIIDRKDQEIRGQETNEGGTSRKRGKKWKRV